MTVTKRDLAKNISIKEELSQKDSSFFLDAVINFIKRNQKSKININRFGTFHYKFSPKRPGRNPKTGKSYNIPSRNRVTFEPSKLVKQILN